VAGLSTTGTGSNSLQTSLHLTRLCRAADVPEDGGLRVELPGRLPVAVFRVGSEYFVTDDRCTHGEGPLSDGTIIGEEIVCPFHMGAFCLRTGEPTAPPCVEPLRTYAAVIRDGEIFGALSAPHVEQSRAAHGG
jgi:nitrite reductase/ring-hydroxylating ferredoxin subunit